MNILVKHQENSVFENDKNETIAADLFILSGAAPAAVAISSQAQAQVHLR